MYEKTQILCDTQDSLQHLISQLQKPKSVEKSLARGHTGTEPEEQVSIRIELERQTGQLDTNWTLDSKKKDIIGNSVLNRSEERYPIKSTRF